MDNGDPSWGHSAHTSGNGVPGGPLAHHSCKTVVLVENVYNLGKKTVLCLPSMNTGLLSFENFCMAQNKKNIISLQSPANNTWPGTIPVLYFRSGGSGSAKRTQIWNSWGHQFNKRLESFAQCYSQCLLQADFKENHRYSSLSSWIAFSKNEKWNEGRKPDQNSSLRRVEFMPRNLD